MNNQYFAYIRVSTVKQGEGVSLEAQREAIERYALNQGLSISRWFEEKETAAKQGRPLFTEMIKALKAGKAKGVIMHKIDRSARNLRDWATVGDLSDAGLDVHFAAESVDFTSRGGRLTADIQAVIAADYIRNLKEETLKGIQGRYRQGLFPNKAPLGYLDTGRGKPKAVDPKRKKLVKLAFELYVTGQYSILGLTDELYERGFRSKSGRKVPKSKIERLLANRYYIGIVTDPKTGHQYKGQHEPIVSAELFARVQKAKDSRTRKKKTKHSHLLRGLFKCRECKNSMIGERQKGVVYYRCHTKKCPTNCIAERYIDAAVHEALGALEMTEEAVREFGDWALQWSTELSERPTQVNQAASVRKAQEKLDRLADKLISGVIADETYTSLRSDLELELMKAKEQEQKQQDRAQMYINMKRFLELAKTLTGLYECAKPSEKRQMLELCFSNRIVVAKTVELTPCAWLQEVVNTMVDPISCPIGGETRRNAELRTIKFEDIQRLGSTPELQEFLRIVENINADCSNAELPEIPTEDGYREAA
ncbi:MAG: recombinase family protein [Cognatishimia activa]